MKDKRIYLQATWQTLFVVHFLIGISSCLRNSDQEIDNSFIYRRYFALSSLSKTLDPSVDVNQIFELKELPDSLVGVWIAPLKARGTNYKGVSYQFGKDIFHTLLVIIVKESDETHIANSSQYLLTVKSDGSFIDGLKVQETLSRDYLDDVFENGMERMSININTNFNKDSFKVNDLTAYLKTTVLKEREDYVEMPEGRIMGKVEIILQEEFELKKETTYKIGPSGKIERISENKVLKKVSEHTGERIKH